MTRAPAPSSSASEIGGAGTVRVWDPLVRVFHWTLAGSFLGAYALEDPRLLHETLGYVALAAVMIRIVWGFVGSEHARFADFVPGPAGLLRYIRDALAGRERRYLGHNPAGGAMVVVLLTMVIVLAVSGWMMTTDAYFGVEWLETLHETVANLTLGLVIFHILGVVWESRRHGENLVLAMVSGMKRR